MFLSSSRGGGAVVGVRSIITEAGGREQEAELGCHERSPV